MTTRIHHLTTLLCNCVLVRYSRLKCTRVYDFHRCAYRFLFYRVRRLKRFTVQLYCLFNFCICSRKKFVIILHI